MPNSSRVCSARSRGRTIHRSGTILSRCIVLDVSMLIVLALVVLGRRRPVTSWLVFLTLDTPGMMDLISVVMRSQGQARPSDMSIWFRQAS